MKHKLKKYLKLSITLLSISLCITACQKDDQSIIDESQLEQTTPIVLNQKIPFEQALHFNKVQGKISKLQTKITNLQSQNKINDEAIEIVTDEVLYITYVDTHTYTFKVLREAPTAYIENIILHYNIETEDYNEYLVQYHVTADEFVNLHEGSLLQTSKNVTITNLEAGFFNNQTQSRGCDRVCSTIFVDCSSGDHHSGNVGTWGGCSALEAPTAYQSCGTVCNEITAPGGPSGGGNSTPYGSGGNVDNTVVVSSPIPNEPCKVNGNTGTINANGDCVQLGLDPIISLNNLTAQTQIKAKITELKGKINENREYGYQFNLSGNNPITYNITEGTLDTDSNGIKFEPASVLTRLEMHTHYDGLDSAFSSEDLFNTVRSAVNANENEEHASILVAPNGKLYALKVNNMQDASSFADNYVDNSGEADEKKFKKMQDLYKIYLVNKANEDCAGTCTDAEYDTFLKNHLAKILIAFSTGLSLYEATEDADGNIAWNPIVYIP